MVNLSARPDPIPTGAEGIQEVLIVKTSHKRNSSAKRTTDKHERYLLISFAEINHS
jgi:hypothetical protein